LTSNLSGLGARIAKIADLVGGKKNLASEIGISESQLYRYISGDSQPTVEPLAAIAKCGNVSLDWLVLGNGSTGLLDGVNEVNGIYSASKDFVTIAEFQDPNHKLSANTVAKPSFNRQWLLKAGLIPDQLRITCAGDDSMSPTIGKGDLLLVNITENEYKGDAIYLLRVSDGILVAKRLQSTIDNGLHLISDNPAYQDQHISQEQSKSLHIAGKIVWSAGLL
jgi:transcriptional regulator with XRE-family HTH domain